MKELCEYYNIIKIPRTAPYNPVGNGQTEGFNKTMYRHPRQIDKTILIEYIKREKRVCTNYHIEMSGLLIDTYLLFINIITGESEVVYTRLHSRGGTDHSTDLQNKKVSLGRCLAVTSRQSSPPVWCKDCLDLDLVVGLLVLG